MLAPDVAVVVDSGDDVDPAIRVVRGPDDATVLLMHGMADPPGIVMTERPVNDQPGLVLEQDREPTAVMTIDFTAGLLRYAIFPLGRATSVSPVDDRPSSEPSRAK